MKIDTSEWKRFRLGRLFDIKKGKRLTAADQEDGNNLYVGAIDSNNGVANHIGQAPIHKGNTISLSYNGSVGEAFYQPDPFWATDDVNVLYPKFEDFNEQVGLFIASVIRQEKYRFSYGRKWTLDNMNATEICLPISYASDGSAVIDLTKEYSEDGYVPDWQFMKDYIESLHHKKISTSNSTNGTQPFEVTDWREYRFGDLITSICKARAINKDDLEDETLSCDVIRYITRTGENNGCEMMADKRNISMAFIERGNAITVGDTTATCFYQDEEFICGDHMVVIRADSWMNKYTGLFITALLQNEQYKYSYGRAFLKDRIEDTILKLPVNAEGHPDWQFMEDYIKSLPYGDRI